MGAGPYAAAAAYLGLCHHGWGPVQASEASRAPSFAVAAFLLLLPDWGWSGRDRSPRQRDGPGPRREAAGGLRLVAPAQRLIKMRPSEEGVLPMGHPEDTGRKFLGWERRLVGEVKTGRGWQLGRKLCRVRGLT